MKIKSNGDVTAIWFKHNAIELNMECILPAVWQDSVVTEPSSIAFFEFNDTLELDNLIQMLIKFQSDCRANIGSFIRK